jgi:RHS repeat-associated protein
MANISYRAASTLTNRYGWNGGNEYEDEGELNYSNTFYRKYDAQIGRFTGVDMLAEQFADLTPYQFGGNNPVLFNDPNGDAFGGARGERLSQMNAHPMGGEYGWTYNLPNYSSESSFYGAIESLFASTYGGSWRSDGNGGSSLTTFGSDAQAFAAGATYANNFNMWGVNGAASSFGAAQGAYYANGGTDVSVGMLSQAMLPSITIYGGIRNGQWKTSRTSYSGFGGGNGTFYTSADGAAKGWASQYGKWSIVNGKEISSLIYESKSGFAYTQGLSWKVDAAKSSPGPKTLFPIYANLLKGLNTVGFIHSHGGFVRPTDLNFSTWSSGWSRENGFDIYGHPDESPKRGVAENYPNLNMYLFTPAGILLRRDSENTTHNGLSYVIERGYYVDPKVIDYYKKHP